VAIGLLESFALAQEVGAKALTTDEILWLVEARRKAGCCTIKSKLTTEDCRRVIVLGKKCKKWKEENR
jgi:hypothetical protein